MSERGPKEKIMGSIVFGTMIMFGFGFGTLILGSRLIHRWMCVDLISFTTNDISNIKK
jgi:hypothetical protein